MNLPKIDLSEAVAVLLARGEPFTAAQLAAATGKSVSSISLAIKALGDRVHRMGAARSTSYALKKDILSLPAQQAVIWPNRPAVSSDWGWLTFLHNDWLHVRSGKAEWLTHRQLPWFLTPLRPQGFLGRELARSVPSFPANPEMWSLGQVLYSAIELIHDPSGALFLNRYQTKTLATPEDGSPLGEYYDYVAKEVGAGFPVGSSAAGEQPKFVVSFVNGRHNIVKFTPPRNTPYGERWHALLQLEKLALDTLRKGGIASAESQLLQTPSRSYLQSVRFDRIALSSVRHVVAIKALHDEFIQDSQENWVKTSQALHAQKLISSQELRTIATIHAFGHYIGNTDMHFGNLSFFVDDVIAPKISLAPVYDMLPMMWRPDPHVGLTDTPVRQQPMPAGFAAEQEQARQWAIEFWEQAALLDIGADLQAASLESARRLKTNFADV
jgi:hypothetical protein